MQTSDKLNNENDRRNLTDKIIFGEQGQPEWQSDNQKAWDSLVKNGHRLARPAKDDLFSNPLKEVDGVGWLGPTVQGKQVLCLAAGGGRQGPLYAAAGADVTVVDLSPAMLQLDREVAGERGLNLKTVQTSMIDLSVLQNAQFDIVIHPVSTCYIPDISLVYAEVARVLRKNGVYISQHKQPANLQMSLDPTNSGYQVATEYYRSKPLPSIHSPSPFRETGTTEFLHRWEQIVGWMCRSGFVIEDLLEPFHAKSESTPGSTGHRSQFVAPYVRIKARRI